MKIIGYGRMSTDKQQLSPKVQADKITAWVQGQQACGLLPADSVFAGVVMDEAVSSRIDMLKRPQGHNLLVTLERGDLVVVASLSRAFRSAADAEKTMLVFDEAGIGIQFLDFQIDTSQPQGKAMLSMCAVWAKLERDLICERTANALESKRKQGLPTRRPSPGWKIYYPPNVPRDQRSKHSKYVPDIEERKIGIACRQLFGKGYTRLETYRAIAKSLRESGSKRRYSERSCVNLAAACCLEFPKVSLQHAARLLGCSVDTISFINKGHREHDDCIKTLETKLKDQGYNL